MDIRIDPQIVELFSGIYASNQHSNTKGSQILPLEQAWTSCFEDGGLDQNSLRKLVNGAKAYGDPILERARKSEILVPNNIPPEYLFLQDEFGEQNLSSLKSEGEKNINFLEINEENLKKNKKIQDLEEQNKYLNSLRDQDLLRIKELELENFKLSGTKTELEKIKRELQYYKEWHSSLAIQPKVESEWRISLGGYLKGKFVGLDEEMPFFPEKPPSYRPILDEGCAVTHLWNGIKREALKLESGKDFYYIPIGNNFGFRLRRIDKQFKKNSQKLIDTKTERSLPLCLNVTKGDKNSFSKKEVESGSLNSDLFRDRLKKRSLISKMEELGSKWGGYE